MKRYSQILIIILAGITIAGCITPQGRQDYTGSGALAGGATGAIVGSMSHNTGAGALVGAVLGGLIGHGLDQEQEAMLRTQAPTTLQRVEESQPLRASDIKALTHAGINDDIIISQIRNSRTIYHLSTADIINLKEAGVSEEVIDFMINTPSQIQSSQVNGVVGNLPPAPLYETIVVPAPGPEYIWVNGSWLWYGDNWNWNRGYWHRPRYSHGHRGHRD